MNHLGRMLTEPVDPPVKVLFVYNCNPLATVPHQNLVRRGLEREDLTTIVFDQVLTDTARYADIVLPATTFVEQYDFARAYGPISLQMTQPVIDAGRRGAAQRRRVRRDRRRASASPATATRATRSR